MPKMPKIGFEELQPHPPVTKWPPRGTKPITLIINLQYPLHSETEEAIIWKAVKFEFQIVRFIAIDGEVKVIPNFENPFCE